MLDFVQHLVESDQFVFKLLILLAFAIAATFLAVDCVELSRGVLYLLLQDVHSITRRHIEVLLTIELADSIRFRLLCLHQEQRGCVVVQRDYLVQFLSRVNRWVARFFQVLSEQ